MLRRLAGFARDESGATSIEYAMIGAVISIVIVTAVRHIGLSMNTRFTGIANAFN